MLNRRMGMGAMLAVAMMGVVGASGMSQPAPVVTANAPRQAKKGLFGGVQLSTALRWGYRGPGTTMAQQQRASKKSRNVKRRRASLRSRK